MWMPAVRLPGYFNGKGLLLAVPCMAGHRFLAITAGGGRAAFKVWRQISTESGIFYACVIEYIMYQNVPKLKKAGSNR